MAVLIHLYSNEQAYGDSEVWCGTDDQFRRGEVESTRDIDKATCMGCLWEARRFGDRAAVRREQLLTEQSRAKSTSAAM